MIARVCLVEDDPIMGESLHQRLSLEGFACDWHHDGATALDAIGREKYAAVVSDIRLPDLSGEDLLGDDGEGTVDSSHPTDLGFVRQADAFEKALKPFFPK